MEIVRTKHKAYDAVCSVIAIRGIFSRSSYQMNVRNNNERFNDILHFEAERCAYVWHSHSRALVFTLLVSLSITGVLFDRASTKKQKNMKHVKPFPPCNDHSGKRKPLPQIIYLISLSFLYHAFRTIWSQCYENTWAISEMESALNSFKWILYVFLVIVSVHQPRPSRQLDTLVYMKGMHVQS